MGDMFTMEVIQNIGDLISLETDWVNVLNEMRYKTIFQTFQWNYLWVQHLSTEKTSLEIYVIRNKEEVIAILPFVRELKHIGVLENDLETISLIGYSDSDYLSFIIKDQYLNDCLDFFVSWFKENQKDTILYLPDINSRFLLNERIESCFQDFTIYKDYVKCYQVDYGDGLDHYVKELSRNYKRKYNKLIKLNDELVIKEEDYTAINIFIDIHTKHWNENGFTGIFKNENYVQFHKNIAKELKDYARFFILYHKERPIGVLYLFFFEDKIYFYSAGYDDDAKAYSPGATLLFYVIQRLYDSDYRCFDMLRGNQIYKKAYANGYTYNRTFVIGLDKEKVQKLIGFEANLKTRSYWRSIKQDCNNTMVSSDAELINMRKEDNVLIVAPHFDDEILGCGAILDLIQKVGAQCTVLYMTDGRNSRLSNYSPEELVIVRYIEAEMSKQYLGDFRSIYLMVEDGDLQYSKETLSRIQGIINIQKFNYIFVPNRNDIHNDHVATNLLLTRLAKGNGYSGGLYEYEVLKPLDFVDVYISFEDCSNLVQAMNCHKSQLCAFDYSFYIKKMQKHRGRQLKGNYAQCFKKIKLKE